MRPIITETFAFFSETRVVDDNMAAIFPQLHPNAKSPEEKLAELESLPLFMKSIPEDPSDDPVISALQSLAHEGTPDGKYLSFATGFPC